MLIPKSIPTPSCLLTTLGVPSVKCQSWTINGMKLYSHIDAHKSKHLRLRKKKRPAKTCTKPFVSFLSFPTLPNTFTNSYYHKNNYNTKVLIVCALPATQHWSHTYIHSLGYTNPSYELETEICSPRCGTLRSFPTQFPILPNPTPREATAHQKQTPLYILSSLVLILQIFKLTYHRAVLLYC